jgi:hypothetical protein
VKIPKGGKIKIKEIKEQTKETRQQHDRKSSTGTHKYASRIIIGVVCLGAW